MPAHPTHQNQPDTETPSIESAGAARMRPVSCREIRDWVLTAQSGARMTYGQGWHLSTACSAEVGEYAKALSDLNLVTLHQSRAGKTAAGLPYLMIRTQKSARGVQI